MLWTMVCAFIDCRVNLENSISSLPVQGDSLIQNEIHPKYLK